MGDEWVMPWKGIADGRQLIEHACHIGQFIAEHHAQAVVVKAAKSHRECLLELQVAAVAAYWTRGPNARQPPIFPM